MKEAQVIYRHDFGAQGGATPSGCDKKRESALMFAATILIGFLPTPALTAPELSEKRIIQMTTRQFMALPEKDFSRLAPDLILSPLIADAYDALEFAAKLHEFGYQGRYRVVVKDLPHTHLVAREIRMAAPSVNFDVVKVTPKATLALGSQATGWT